MFAMMHLRKKVFKFSGFRIRNPDPDYTFSGFLKFFELFYDIDHSWLNAFLRSIKHPILERIVHIRYVLLMIFVIKMEVQNL